MKVFSKHILFFGAILSTALLSSCRSQDIDDLEDAPKQELRPRMSLNIMPISLGPVNGDVTEMIGSLRIVILSETTEEVTDETTGEVSEQTISYVEYNELFDFAGTQENGMFTGPGEVANTFRFIITRNTVPGLKKFYLIANESEVTDIKFQGDPELPAILDGVTSLTDFLNYYSADYIADLDYPEIGSKPAEGEPKGAEFEALVNSIYYTPEFNQKVISQDPPAQNRYEIFLPYTSYYEYQMTSQPDVDAGKPGSVNILDGKIYLVPCATKFRFEFQNYRPHPVVIPSFKLGGIASDMFLFAQVYSEEGSKSKADLYKDFGAQKNLWWVDWLANVSELSQNYPIPDENFSFSQQFGWMNLYKIPDDAFDYDQVGDIMDNETRKGVVDLVADPNEPWEVPENTTPDQFPGTPGTLLTGYYYFPESRYMVDFPMYDDNGEPMGSQSLQAYYLKLEMKSGPLGERESIASTQIGNLGSMFRNTNTFITIKLRDALDVGAYAELEPWDVAHTNGTVLEETEE